MVFMIPQKYECPKCGTTVEWADNGGVASVPIINGAPTCPKCWADFVRSNVPTMQLDRGEDDDK